MATVRMSLLACMLLSSWTTRAAVSGPRAIDRRNEELLAQAESAVAAHEPGVALEALLSVDDTRRALDRARLLRVRALASVEVGAFDGAIADLDALAARDVVDDTLHVARARAEAGLGHPAACADAVVLAAAAVVADDDVALLASRCAAEAGRADMALAILDGPLAARPASTTVRLRRAHLRIAAGAVAVAAEDLDALVNVVDADAALALAAALRRVGAHHRADAWLSATAARFPDDARVLSALARVSSHADPARAAHVASAAAFLDDAAAVDAAQLLREAGAPRRASLMASRVVDNTARLRQRVALLVDAHAWDRVIALRDRLQRAALLDDDAIRYALAWAYAATGGWSPADQLLDGIVDATLFERATQLRDLMARCRAFRAQVDPTTEDPCPR